MRRLFFRISALALVAGAATACKQDQIVKTDDIPTAGVRFINAVPDTGAMDMRFIDVVESNAQFNIGFRNNVVTSAGVPASTQVEYKNTRAGQRHFRVFMSSTNQALASTVVKDTTVTIEAGKLYTVLMWGSSKPGASPAMRLSLITEAAPDPGAQVALRVINATNTTIDAAAYLATGTAPTTNTWTNIGPLSISNYATVAPAQYKYAIRNAGSTTSLFTDATALIGQAATVDIEATPGTTVAGSAVTGIVFPRSTAGTGAPQAAAFNTPAISFFWDRRPPRTCSPLC